MIVIQVGVTLKLESLIGNLHFDLNFQILVLEDYPNLDLPFVELVADTIEVVIYDLL